MAGVQCSYCYAVLKGEWHFCPCCGKQFEPLEVPKSSLRDKLHAIATKREELGLG